MMRAAERDARGKIGGMALQTRAAGLDRVVEGADRRNSSASAANAIDAGSARTGVVIPLGEDFSGIDTTLPPRLGRDGYRSRRGARPAGVVG